MAEHGQRRTHNARSFPVASLFAVCHHPGCVPEILLRLDQSECMDQSFVLDDEQRIKARMAAERAATP